MTQRVGGHLVPTRTRRVVSGLVQRGCLGATACLQDAGLWQRGHAAPQREDTRIIFNVTPYPTPYVSGQFVCSFNCNSVRSLILIKLPTAKLNQLPKQTSSVLTAAANLPSQQAPLGTYPRHTLQGPAAWHSCTDGGARDGSTAGRGPLAGLSPPSSCTDLGQHHRATPTGEG